MSDKSQRIAGEVRASIPHFRVYKSFLTPAGEVRSLMVQASPDMPPLKTLLSMGDVIADKDIRALVVSARLTFPLNNEDVAVLAEGLNIMRVTKHAKDAAPFHLESAMNRVTKNIDGLLRDLPKLIKFGREAGSRGSAPAFDALEMLRSTASLADEWLTCRAANYGRKRGTKRRSAPWHDDMQYLAGVLRVAAGRLGKSPSFSQPTAPAVEFIHAALKRAHVNHGKKSPCDAIAREMARYQTDIKKLLALQYKIPRMVQQ